MKIKIRDLKILASIINISTLVKIGYGIYELISISESTYIP